MSEEVSGAETDWLANCAYCYGIGYTKEQALEAMAQYLERDVEGKEVDVDLFEHVGDYEMTHFNLRFDNLVTHERVTVDGDALQDLRSVALDAFGKASTMSDKAEVVEE